MIEDFEDLSKINSIDKLNKLLDVACDYLTEILEEVNTTRTRIENIYERIVEIKGCNE